MIISESLTPGRLAEALHECRELVDGEEVVMFTDDRVYVAAQRLVDAVESKVAAADVVRGARRRLFAPDGSPRP